MQQKMPHLRIPNVDVVTSDDKRQGIDRDSFGRHHGVFCRSVLVAMEAPARKAGDSNFGNSSRASGGC